MSVFHLPLPGSARAGRQVLRRLTNVVSISSFDALLLPTCILGTASALSTSGV